MTERVLRPSRLRALAIALGGVALAELGYGGTLLGVRAAWFLVGAGFFITSVFIGGLATDRFHLRLNEEGVTVGALLRRVTYRWDEITEFAVVKMPVGVESVVFSLTEGGKARHPTASRLERAAGGYDAGLPDTYGMTAEALCTLLTAEQARRLAWPRDPRESASSPTSGCS